MQAKNRGSGPTLSCPAELYGLAVVTLSDGTSSYGLYRVKQVEKGTMLLSHGAFSFPVGTLLDPRISSMKHPITLPSINAPQLSRMATMASDWPGNPETMERSGQTILRVPVNSSNANQGILLALDGHCLAQPAFPYVLQLCRNNSNRLDILLLNAPRPATLMLGKLLQQLEKEGIDYRLSSGEGALADELPVYLRRFKYISFILLNCLDKWDTRLHATLDALSQDGYQVLTRLTHDDAAPL